MVLPHLIGFYAISDISSDQVHGVLYACPLSGTTLEKLILHTRQAKTINYIFEAAMNAMKAQLQRIIKDQ